MKPLPCINTLLVDNYIAYRERQLELADREYEDRKDALYEEMSESPEALIALGDGHELVHWFGDDLYRLLNKCLRCPGADAEQLTLFTEINNYATSLAKQMAEHIAEREL